MCSLNTSCSVFLSIDTFIAYYSPPMKHECVSGLECGCRIQQFLKKVDTGAAGLGD